ncbi:hypothetical protein GCM10020370_43660 [Paenibacillus hodogayensis]
MDMLMIRSSRRKYGRMEAVMGSTVQSIYQALWITALIAVVIYVAKQMFKRD